MQGIIADVKSQLDRIPFGVGALPEIRSDCHFLKDFPWM